MTAVVAAPDDAVIIGAGYAALWVAGELRQAGMKDIVILGYPQFGAEVTSEVFDDTTDLWTVHTRCGISHTARVLVATRDFDGHAAAGFGDAAIQQTHRDDPAYLGIAFRRCPNYFVMAGAPPGTGLQASMLMIEKQASLIRAVVSGLAEHRCTRVELKPHLQTHPDRSDEHRPRGKVPFRRWRRKPDISAFEYTRTECPDGHIHR